MIKTIYSAVLVLFAISVFSISSFAAPGDLFVMVDLDEDTEVGCSILKVDPQGSLSIFLTDEEITDATGLDGADCEDAYIACDTNGEIYFSDDFSPGAADVSRILRGGPTAGIVSLFTPNSTINAATPEDDVDLDSGLTFGPDGNLYATDDATDFGGDSVLRITVPGSEVSVTIPEEQVEALTGEDASFEGGVAVDPDLNIYVVDRGPDHVFRCRPGGPCSILTTEDEFEDAAGVGDVELSEAILLVGNQLYVAEDSGCNCIFVINILTGTPEVFLSESQLESVLVTGASPEGGLAVDSEGRIYVANNFGDMPSILRTGPNADVSGLSLFVNPTDVAALYSDNDTAEFQGGICIASTELTAEIPTLSEWSMIAMAGVLGVIGLLFVMRRRAVSA